MAEKFILLQIHIIYYYVLCLEIFVSASNQVSWLFILLIISVWFQTECFKGSMSLNT